MITWRIALLLLGLVIHYHLELMPTFAHINQVIVCSWPLEARPA